MALAVRAVCAPVKEVLRLAIEDVGECLERTFERVERSFRRNRCGSKTGKDGQESGIFDTEKKRCVESSPPREKYVGAILAGILKMVGYKML